jgi:hypothetical protein
LEESELQNDAAPAPGKNFDAVQAAPASDTIHLFLNQQKLI